MAQAVVISQPGGFEVLQLTDLPVGAPAPDQVKIRQKAIEVNFIDIYQRRGDYPISAQQKIPGVSAVGEVIELGSNIKNFKIGDRVAYCTSPSGAYTSERNIAAELLFPVDPDISDKNAAAMLVKGMTAHYLACRTYITGPGKAVLIHAAAGGVGQALTRLCRFRETYIIGTVGSDEKKQIALDAGCHKVFNYRTENWAALTREATFGFGVNTVYDAVGKDTFLHSLECLGDMGLMVLYGMASGPVNEVDLKLLAAKSLFLTRPSIFNYKKNRMELVLTANDIWSYIRDKVFEPAIYAEFPLAQAAEAHKLLESRKSTGSIILIP